LGIGLSAPSEVWAARRGLRDPRSREPHFHETWDRVQRFRDESLGRQLVPPIPVRPLPFPAGPIGYSLSAVDTGCDPGANSSLRVACLLEASVHLSTAPGSAFPSAPLLGFRPLQRSTIPGARIPRRFHPPARSVLDVSHVLDVLLRQKPYGACFIPAALLGFHRIRSLAMVFRPQQGEPHPGCLSKALSPPVTNGSPPLFSHALRRIRRRGTLTCPRRRRMIYDPCEPRCEPTGTTES